MTEPQRRFTAEPAEPHRPAAGPPSRWRRLTGACRSAPNDFVRGVGLATEPPAARWLIGSLVLAMLGAVGVSLAAAGAPGGLPHPVEWFAVAAGAMALSQLFWLTFRTAAGRFLLGWGEAALIVCLYAVPPAWVPTVVAVGSLVAHLLLYLFRKTASLAIAMRNVAGVTLGGSAGALAAVALAAPYQARLDLRVAIALCAAAAAYLAVTVGVVAGSAAARRRAGFASVFAQTLRAKLVMVVGNIGVGLIIIVALRADWRFILLLTPVFWLLQQLYAHRLRADDERRVWQAFSLATKALNQLDEHEVALAAVEGARTLFTPWRTEVVVLRPDGGRRTYLAERTGPIVEVPGDRTEEQPDQEYSQAVRALTVGTAHVGELRLTFRELGGLTARQLMTFSSFGDALAAALHDAATHRELQVITARRTFEAAHDPLTGLPNRATILAGGDVALRQLDREAQVALLLLDVDHFKEVNDTLGHAAGDDLLRTAARRLTGLARQGELVARLGGDEFALLLTALPADSAGTPGPMSNGGVRAVPWPGDLARSPLRYALRRARELAEHLAAPTEVAGLQLSVEASVGVVVAPAGSVDMSELLRRADIAMYQAKRGGASVQWYDSAKDGASTDRLALLAELREALAAQDQLVLALQPAVDLATGGPTGVEALIRWRHPRRGLLHPIDFVRAVESSELLGAFTRHVIDRALALAADWAAQGLEVPISVNLSPRSLLDPHLPADVAELLRRHQIPARRLVLEITETVVMSELEVIDEVLAGLRELGVQLAVDDFGTGYSSLTFLTRITVDEVKVDRAFVAKMVDSPEAAAIVRATVDLGKRLGLRVVAEGVETDEQRKLLTAMGCSSAQGYRFVPPMPAEKVGELLRTLAAEAKARVIPLRADGA